MSGSRGFTLLELIITVVLVGILAALFVPAMGTHLTRSADPLGRGVGEAQALSDLEAVLRNYVLYLNTDTNPAGVLAHMQSTYAGNSSVSLSWIKFDAVSRNETSGDAANNDGLKITARGPGGFSYSMLLTNERNATSYDPVNY